jgi:plastocyanin
LLSESAPSADDRSRRIRIIATNPGIHRRCNWHWALIPIAIGTGLLSGCATTGAIRGRVQMPGKVSQRQATEPVIMAWLEAGTPPVRPAGRARIAHAGGKFVPSVLVVVPGTTVEFVNQDRVYHNAFSVSPKMRFDLGTYSPGRSRETRFNRAGIVQIFCELHKDEMGFIVVAPDRWHTRPQPDGAFALHDLPPGSYMVRVWHPKLGGRTERVEVGGKNPAIVDFAY